MNAFVNMNIVFRIAGCQIDQVSARMSTYPTLRDTYPRVNPLYQICYVKCENARRT